MVDSGMSAGMEIKTDEPVFENQFVDAPVMGQPAEQQAVILSRTPQGLIRDEENGKEISSIFEILEPGDCINHQTVVEVNDNGIVLDYFGKTTQLSSEFEIFSVLIKDEIEEWIKGINKVDFNKAFENVDSVDLFRALELICINTNVELVKNLYVAHNDKLNERMAAIVATTLRKSFVDSQEDLNGAEVISLSINYNKDEVTAAKADIESRNGKYLYHISLFNPNNEEVNEGDRIAC